MKTTKRHTFRLSLPVLLSFLLTTSCGVFDADPIQNPNNPSVESVLNNATKAQLQNLVTGLEFRHRATTASNNIYSTFGREIYPLFASDPRFVNQWVGVGEGADAENDPSFFGSAGIASTGNLSPSSLIQPYFF